jgi:23S rRNA A1618 N6-methylase RlmF
LFFYSGVGASCIYPLLGCSTNPSWNFLGTDIDERSVKYAKENVKKNNLQDRITIKYNPDPRKIFVLDVDMPIYTFSMCNPPFYNSQEELDQGLLNKELEPSAVSLYPAYINTISQY